MREYVDTLIIISNDRLLEVAGPTERLLESFSIANGVLCQGVESIRELIDEPGLINVDFADVRTIMREMGDALMGTGVATGENRAVEAAHAAISSPLLEGVSIAGAQGILLNITGDPDMTLVEIDEATSIIHEAAGDEANVILGTVIDENLKDDIMLTVIATGFNKRVAAHKPMRAVANLIDRIPSGPADLQRYDEPTYMRRGVELPMSPLRPHEAGKEKIDKSDPDKPAFLRKIMD